MYIKFSIQIMNIIQLQSEIFWILCKIMELWNKPIIILRCLLISVLHHLIYGNTSFFIIIAQDVLFKVPTFLFIYCIQSSKEEPSTELHPVLELALLLSPMSDFDHLPMMYLYTNSELYSVRHNFT